MKVLCFYLLDIAVFLECPLTVVKIALKVKLVLQLDVDTSGVLVNYDTFAI